MKNSDSSLKIDNLDLDLGDSLSLDLDLSLSFRDRADSAPASSGSLESDFQEELDDAAKAIKAYYKQSYERQKQITDSGYYFCVCFQTAQQCRDFLKAVGWEGPGEAGARFLNGMELARRMGVKLEKTTERPKLMPPRPRFLDEALEVECDVDVEKAKEPSGSAYLPPMPAVVRNEAGVEPTQAVRKRKAARV